MPTIKRKRLNQPTQKVEQGKCKTPLVLSQVNIDLDKIRAFYTNDIAMVLHLTHISSGAPNRPRPGLDYYDNRRDRHDDDSLVPHQGTYGQYKNDDK